MPGSPSRKWLSQFRENTLRYKKSFAFARASKHHDELVAANSRSFIGGPNDRLYSISRFFQNEIARLMAKRIIYILETVHIDQDESNHFAIFMRT